VATPEQRHARWPEHLPVGALRVVRWSARYDETVIFYRDIIGLPVLETFHDSYGLDGTILGLPGGPVHLEIVRSGDTPRPTHGLDQLVFYLHGWRQRASTRLRRSTIGRPTAVLPTRTRTGEKWCSRRGSTARRDPDQCAGAREMQPSLRNDPQERP
jgi:hypothetical protein